jgi:voltage-gated potassium channel
MLERPEVIARRRLVQQRRRSRRELQQFMRRLAILLVLLLIVLIVGSTGFAAFEHVSVGFGFVWTMDTITTLGAIHEPGDTAGRTLQVVLELVGIGTLFYGFATVVEFFVSGQLSGVVTERRAEKMIDSYHDHYIICGFGRVGRQVARDLRAAGARYVVIDHNPDNRESAEAAEALFVESSASDDEVLLDAGIERATGVIACVDSDAENIFITLTARELRSDILIIARASREESEKKLLRAGANRVISPYKTSGHAMARVALHPQVGDAVVGANYRMEEIEVSPACEGAGRSIDDIRGRSVIVALGHPGGAIEPQPAPQTVIQPGDRVFALGTPEALERLEAMFQPAVAPSS